MDPDLDEMLDVNAWSATARAPVLQTWLTSDSLSPCLIVTCLRVASGKVDGLVTALGVKWPLATWPGLCAAFMGQWLSGSSTVQRKMTLIESTWKWRAWSDVHSFIRGNNGEEAKNLLVIVSRHDGETIVVDVIAGLGWTILHNS